MSDEILNLQSIHPFKTRESTICNKRRYNTIDSHSGVLASSGENGLYIYDLNNYEKLSEASTTRKDKLIEHAPFLKIHESEEVSWLEFNCDGSLLLISSSDENNNVKAIKIIDITKTFEQLREIILCTFQPNFQCKLNDLKWHPNENNTLLIVLNDIVHLCNVKNGELLIINSKSNSFCASWSPKGKQFSVVMKSEQNGNFIINQYDNIMTEKRSTEIAQVSNEFKVNFSLIPIEICWYSTYNYIIGFRGDTQATEQFKVYTCSFGIKTNKIQVLTDVVSSSDCINPCPGPLARLYYLHILDWNMVVLVNNSCESAVIYEYDKDSNLEMVSTYCLPIEGNVTGLSCDFTSEKNLKLNSSENKSFGSYPMIIISMSNGYCFGIYLIHSTKILQKKIKIKIQHDKFISNDIIKETNEVIVNNENRIGDKLNLLMNSEPQDFVIGEKNEKSLNNLTSKQEKIEINSPSKPNLFGSVDIKNSSNSNFFGSPNNNNVKGLFVMEDVSNSTNTNTVSKTNLFGSTNIEGLKKPSLFGSANSEGTKPTLFGPGSAENANKENANKSSLFSTENLESNKTFPSTNVETATKQNLFGSTNSENTKTTLFGTNKGESDSKQTLFGSTSSDGTVKQTLFGNIGNVPKTNIFSPTNSNITPKSTLFCSTNTDRAPLSNLFGSTNSDSSDKTALSTSRHIDSRPKPIPLETENTESVSEPNLLKSEHSEKSVQKTILKSNIDNPVSLNTLNKKLETNKDVQNFNTFSTNTSNDKGEIFKSTKASSSTRKNILQSQVSGDNDKSDKKTQEDCKTIKIPGNRHSFKMEVVDNVLGDALNCLKERIEQIKLNTNDHILKSQSLFNKDLMKNEISQMFNDTEKYSIIVKKIEMSNNNSNMKSKSLFQDIDLSLEFTTRLQSTISESKEKNKSIKSSGNPLLKKTALNLIDLKEKVNCSLKELEEALDHIEKEKNYEPIVLRNRSQFDDVNRIINIYRKSMCIEKSKIGLLKQHLKSSYESDTDEFNYSRVTNVKSQFQDQKMEQHLYSLMCKRRVENLSFLSEECNSTIKANAKKPLKNLSRNINTPRKSTEFLLHNEVKSIMSPARFKLVDKEIYKSPVKNEKTNLNISPVNSNEKSKILVNQSLDKPVFNASAASISELGGTKTTFNPSISKTKFIIPKDNIDKDSIKSIIPKIEESETPFNFTYNFPSVHAQGCNSENLNMKKSLSSLESSTNMENSSTHDENNYQQLQNVIKSEKSILNMENQNKDINTPTVTCTEPSNTTMFLKCQNSGTIVKDISISQVDSNTKVLNTTTRSTSFKTPVTESNFTIEKPVGGFLSSSITKNQQSSGLITIPTEKNDASSLQSIPFNKKFGSASIENNILDQKVATSTGSTDMVDTPLTVSSHTSDFFGTNVSTNQLGKGNFTNPLTSTINTPIVTSSIQLTGLLSNSSALFTTLNTPVMKQSGIFGQTSSNKQNGSLFSSPLTTSSSPRGLFTHSVTTAAPQDTDSNKTIEPVSTETSSSEILTLNINKTGVGSPFSNIFTTQQSGLFSLQSQNQTNSYSESVNKSNTTSLFAVSSPSTQTSGLFGSMPINKSNEGLFSNTSSSSSSLFSSANQNQQGSLFGTCVVSSQSENSSSSVKSNSGLFVNSVATKTSSTSLFGSPSVSVGVTQIVSQSNNKVTGGLFSTVSPNNLSSSSPIGSSNNQQESGLTNKSSNLFGNNMKVEQNGGVFTNTTQGSDLFGSISINKSNNLLPNSVNDLFSSPTSNSGSGGLFSNSRSSGLFSNPISNSGSGGLFSSPTSNSGSSGLFSNSISNSRSGGLFSNPTSNSGSGGLFSNPTSNSGSGGLFSNPTSNSGSGGLFSNPTSNSGSSGLFSNPTSNSGSGGLFSNPTSNSGSGSLFSNPTSNSDNGGLFSNSCQSQSSGGLFGGISSNISQQAGLLNQSNKSTNAGLFGNSTSSNQSSGFFGKNAPSPKTGNLFDSSNLFSSQQGDLSQINSTTSGFSFGSSFISGLGGSQVSNNSSNIFASVRTSSSTGNSSSLFVSNNQSSSLFTTNSKANNVQTSSLFGSRPSFGNATPTLGQNNNIQSGGGLFSNSIFGNSNDNQITFGDMATNSDNQESFGMTNDIFQVGNLFQSSSTSPSFTQRRM